MSSGGAFILANNSGPEDRLLDGDTFVVSRDVLGIQSLNLLLIILFVIVAIIVINNVYGQPIGYKKPA